MDNGYLRYLTVLVDSVTKEEFEREIRLFIEREKSEIVLSSLIKYMDTQIKDSEVILEDEHLSKEELDFVKELIEMIQNKKQLTLDIIEEYRRKSEKNLEEDSKDTVPKVVFAKNEYGSIICSKQLEKVYDYHDGKYEQTIDLLSNLFNGITQSNDSKNLQKERMLVNDESVKGIFELKDFQVRIFYMRENEYTVITGVYIKKSDTDTKHKNTAINSKDKSRYYRELIANNELDMNKELEESQNFFEELLSRTKKKGIN